MLKLVQLELSMYKTGHDGPDLQSLTDGSITFFQPMCNRKIKMRRVLAAAFLAVLICSSNGCDRTPAKSGSERSALDSLRFSGQPISDRPHFKLTDQSLSEIEVATRKFKEQLQVLADYANQVRESDGEPRIPDVFAKQFETTFVERNKLASVYLGERIRIARWRVSDTTPTSYDTIAVQKLFETLVEPWKDATRFRIEFNIHTVSNRPNYFDAEVLVDISGNLATDNGSGDVIGRSATGLWQFIWQKQKDGVQPTIKKINMSAHEETINYVSTGTLFNDCTQSVLRNAPDLQASLAHGLDDWAKQIPGLDIAGNNGLAIGDVNNDGLDDVYLCQPHGLPNILLVQNPDGTADNLAAEYGVDVFDDSTAALIVDIDNDRKQDLVLATDNRLALYSNSGNRKFQLEHKLKIGHGTSSLSAVDYDQDGDLDLFLTKFRPVSVFDDLFPQPNVLMAAINGGRNVLLQNDEAWSFKDVTSDVGLSFNNQQYTRSANWCDYDADGDLDLYICNEFHQDALLENQNGWFNDAHATLMSGAVGNSTTVSTGDFNRDGKPDFFVGADAGFVSQRITHDYIVQGGKHLKHAKGFAAPNRIFHKTGGKTVGQFDFPPPIFSSESTYGSVVGDFNNDGWEDVALTNGWLSRSNQVKAESLFYHGLFDPKHDFESATKNGFALHHEISDLCRKGDSFKGFQRNRCLLSFGPMRFTNVSNASGIDFRDDSRAIASTDWDGDGDVDLVVVNRTAPRLRFLRNSYVSKNQFLKLKLVGTQSNRDAIGSRVEVFLRGAATPLVKTLAAVSGRMAQSSKVMHFGLGKGTSVERVVVHWPNGSEDSFEKITANTIYELVEGKTEPAEIPQDRYRIALDSKALASVFGIPAAKRIRFFPTTRLPILQYRSSTNDEKQKWYRIENADQRPLFCVFCPANGDWAETLRDWNIREPNFAKLKTDFVVAFTGNNSDGDNELRNSAKQIDEAGFKFRWGVLSKSSNKKLEQLCGQWFYNQKLPDKPFGILLDGLGNVHFAYHHGQLIWENVGPDLQNVAEGNFVLNQVPARANENWIVSKRFPRFDRLARRFDEIGYVRDAKIYKDLLASQHAYDYLNRAIDLASKGSLVSALSAAEKSVELNPECVDCLVGLADVSRKYALTADQQARARILRIAGELLDKSLDLDSVNEEAILARAEIFRLQKDIENALSLLHRYLTISPESWKVHAIVGRLYFHKKEYFEATKHLIAAIENRPTLPFVASDLGYLYLLNEQFADSKEFLELAIRLQPSDQNLPRFLAEAEFWNGTFDKAGDLYAETVKTQPTLSHPKKMLALLKGASPYADFRDGNEGYNIIKPFIDTTSDQSPASMEIMAICLAEMGDFERALSIQKDVVSIVENKQTLERYTDSQLSGMRDRLELFKRRRVYRLKDAAEVPVELLGGAQFQ